MTDMVIPAFRDVRDIERERSELVSCIRRVKDLETRVGYTAKSHRARSMPISEVRQRLTVLQQRVDLLRNSQ